MRFSFSHCTSNFLCVRSRTGLYQREIFTSELPALKTRMEMKEQKLPRSWSTFRMKYSCKEEIGSVVNKKERLYGVIAIMYVQILCFSSGLGYKSKIYN